MPELDRLAKSLPPQEFDKFSKELSEMATGSTASSEKVAILIDEKLKTLDSGPTTLARSKQMESERLVSGTGLVG